VLARRIVKTSLEAVKQRPGKRVQLANGAQVHGVSGERREGASTGNSRHHGRWLACSPGLRLALWRHGGASELDASSYTRASLWLDAFMANTIEMAILCG
jgi:hypothetical protein